MISPRVIVFEGLDRAGKTTLCRVFAEKTNQVHTCLDRWTITCRVYDMYFQRQDDRRDINTWRTRLEDTMINDFGLTIVMVDTEPELCVERGTQYDVQQMGYQRTLFMEQLRIIAARGAEVLVLPTSRDGITLSKGRLVTKCRTALHI